MANEQAKPAAVGADGSAPAGKDAQPAGEHVDVAPAVAGATPPADSTSELAKVEAAGKEAMAAVELVASLYGIVHSGDHLATLQAVGEVLGHRHDDPETLLDMVRKHAGV